MSKRPFVSGARERSYLSNSSRLNFSNSLPLLSLRRLGFFEEQNFCISRSILDIKMSFMSVLAFEFHKTLHAAFGKSRARYFTASANAPLETVCFGPEAYWILT